MLCLYDFLRCKLTKNAAYQLQFVTFGKKTTNVFNFYKKLINLIN